MKKTGFFLVIFVLLLLFFAQPCYAADESDTYISQSGIYESAAALESETKTFLKEIGLGEITAQNVYALDFFTVLKTVFDSFQNAFRNALKTLTVIAGTVLLSAFAQSFGEGTKGQTIQHILHPVSVCVIVLCSSASFAALIGEAAAGVRSAAAFSISAVPIMCVICAAQGKAVSASLCSAATVGISQVLNTCFSVYFIPAANIMLALGISACANNTLHLDKAVKLIRKYLLIFLGGGALVYFTVLSVRTSVSSAVDESTVKTIKFASANFIPVIGGAIGDSAQAVAASLAVSKSTVGVFGLFCILAIFIPIISKILVWIIGLEICSLFFLLFSLDQETVCLKHLADTLTVFIVVIIFCVTMFFINFGVLLTLRGAV